MTFRIITGHKLVAGHLRMAPEGLFQGLPACGVHDPANPKFLMPITRRLFGRSGLTQTEIDLLRGICAAIIRPKRERKGSKTGA